MAYETTNPPTLTTIHAVTESSADGATINAAVLA